MMAALGMAALATGGVTAQDPSPTSDTSGPIPEWTPAWSPGPPDATHEIRRDTFDASGTWWTGSDDVGTSRVTFGDLRWTIAQDGQSIWDVFDLPLPLQEARVEASVVVEEGTGAGGPLCAGSDESRRAIWAGVNGDGEWLVGRIADSRVQVIERGEMPIVRRHDVPVGAPYPKLVTLECTVDPEGVDHYAVWIEGVQVADVVEDEPVGPFLRAGLIASADEAGLLVVFDEFAVFGGPEALGSPGPSAAVVPSPSSAPAP
ncbi:MAG: hypothetical protein ABWZ82_03320 [Candidatus Limnocylindrales bacterium]